jgi:hypothetical protein
LQALKIPKRRNPIQTLEAEEVPKEEKCIFPVTRKKIPSIRIVRARDEITKIAIENSLQCCSLLSKQRDLLNPRTDPLDSKKTDLVNPRTDHLTPRSQIL